MAAQNQSKLKKTGRTTDAGLFMNNPG